MKRSSEVLLFAAALAVAALVPQLNAQDNPPADKGPRGPRGGPRPIEMILEHAKDLGLTDDQITKLKAVQEESRPQLEAIMQDQSLSREQKREKAQPIMKEGRAKIEAILTPEQREKMKELGGKMRGKGPRGHGADKDGPPPPPEAK